MLYALIDDNEQVTAERNIDPPDAVKLCANGNPRLRPVTEVTPALGKLQRIGGHSYVVDAGSVAKTFAIIDPTSQEVKNAANAPILAEIGLKERAGIRRMREVLLKLAQAALPAGDSDHVALEAVENALAAARAKLAP